MILAQMDGDNAAADAAATQLILDEVAVRSDPEQIWMQDDRFLLGIPMFANMNAEWVRLAGLLRNANEHPATVRAIEALLKVFGVIAPVDVSPLEPHKLHFLLAIASPG